MQQNNVWFTTIMTTEQTNEGMPINMSEQHININHYILLQHVSDALYGHHQVVLQMHSKEACFCLAVGLPFTNSKYRIWVTWLLFQTVEQ
jgi:hypothetical protein